MWRYNEGDVTHVGAGHSGEITGVKISPDGRYIVSVSNDGAIMRWRFPSSYGNTETMPIIPTLNLPAEGTTSQTEVISPKQEIAMGGSRREQEEMEVGGATPKQEE